MEAEQRSGGGLNEESSSAAKAGWRWPAIAANILLSILLLGAVWPRRDRMWTPQATSYQIGRSLGLLIISLLISYGIWRLFRRIRGSPARWSPWVLLIAALVAMFFKAPSTQGGAGASGSGSEVSSAHIAPLSPEDIFVDIPGLRYAPLRENALQRLEESYLANGVPQEVITSIDGRIVFEGRRKVGVVSVVFTTPEVAAADDFGSGFISGFTDSIEEQGSGPARVHELSHGPAHGGRLPQGYTIAFARENAGIFVLGGNRTTAELIADALLRSTD